MKRKSNNGGYSLIEVLVAISILGIIVSPVCANLIMSLRATEKTDEILQAQLAVSSAVETLMAEGIGWENHINSATDICKNDDCADKHGNCYYDQSEQFGKNCDRFKDITVETWLENPDDLYYKVEVQCISVPSVSVSTYIRAVDEIPDTTYPDNYQMEVP